MNSNLFVSIVKYSETWQIVFATLTYAANYLTGFFISGTSKEVKYIMSGLGAALNGIGSSFICTLDGTYIHKVCHLYDKIHLKGYYYGIFNTILCISIMLGAVIVTFGLTLFTSKVYFAIIACLAFMAFLYGLCFIKDL